MREFDIINLYLWILICCEQFQFDGFIWFNEQISVQNGMGRRNLRVDPFGGYTNR